MTDDFAIEGATVGYVPCQEQAAALDAEEEGAIYGIASGFVARDQEADDLPADEREAIVGSAVGFVAKPCCEEPNPLTRPAANGGEFNILPQTGHTFSALGVGGTAADSWIVMWIRLYSTGGVTCSTPAGWTAHPDNGLANGDGGTVFCFYVDNSAPWPGWPAVTITFSASTRWDNLIERVDGSEAVGGFGVNTGVSPTIAMGVIAGTDEKHIFVLAAGLMSGSAYGGVVTTPDADTDTLLVTSNAYTGFIEGRTNHDWPGEASPGHEVGGSTSVTHDYAALSIAFLASACP